MSALPKTEDWNEVIHILAAVPFFSEIKDDPNALRSIGEIMQFRKFHRGHALIEEGKLGDEFFVLVKGQVSVLRSTPEGDVFKVAILKQEMHPTFGEGALVEAEPRSATVMCDEDCQCLVLTRSQFTKFCDEYPKWAVPIFKKIALSLMKRVTKTNHDLLLIHKALMNEIRGQ